jgi:ABC-type antimicrobial peptide transport system permease subunit
LSVLGTYALISFNVTQRTKEIGIRMALGAAPSQVLRGTVWRGIAPVAAGLAGGLTLASAVTHVLSTMLFEVRPNDPGTLAAVTMLLICAALIACLIPARRATRVNPVVALRHDP